MTTRRLAYDEFTADVVWCPDGEEPAQWRKWTDADYVDMRIVLEQRGFKDLSVERLRSGVHHCARAFPIDTAIEWLTRLKWDGVERVEMFLADYVHAEDTPYTRALSRYIWSGLAGRVLEPGVKCDMVPILAGPEGIRKTSLVEAMAPSDETFGEIDLMKRDEDTSRGMRGKLVLEMGELRGLHTRDSESILSFITRRFERWVPKYMEMATEFKRRALMIGTTNKATFLSDQTGMRRWLPTWLDRDIDVDRVIADRGQLWAEGAVLFAIGGVDWSVEDLAKDEQEKFKEGDSWDAVIVRWLRRPDAVTHVSPLDKPFEWTAADVLVEALGFKPAQLNRGLETRVGICLKRLGAESMRSKAGRVYGFYGPAKAEIAGIASEERSAL